MVELTCLELLAYLSDYIDNNLDETLSAAARHHLSTCQNCRVVLDTTQQTILLYREQDPLTIPLARRQQLFNELQATFLARQSPE